MKTPLYWYRAYMDTLRKLVAQYDTTPSRKQWVLTKIVVMLVSIVGGAHQVRLNGLKEIGVDCGSDEGFTALLSFSGTLKRFTCLLFAGLYLTLGYDLLAWWYQHHKPIPADTIGLVAISVFAAVMVMERVRTKLCHYLSDNATLCLLGLGLVEP